MKSILITSGLNFFQTKICFPLSDIFTSHLITFSFATKAFCECQYCQCVIQLNGKQNLPAKIKRSLSLSLTRFSCQTICECTEGHNLQLLSIVHLRRINIYEKVRKERGEGAFLDFQSNQEEERKSVLFFVLRCSLFFLSCG